MDFQAIGFSNLEYFNQADRILLEPVIARRFNPASKNLIAVQSARLLIPGGKEAAPFALFRDLLVDMGKKHPCKTADSFGLQEVELHEAFNSAFAGAVRKVHPGCNFALQVECEPILRAVCKHMQMTAHSEQKPLCTPEAAVFRLSQKAHIDEFRAATDLMDVFADPVERLKVAQTAFAFFDIGLNYIPAVAHPLVAIVAFGQFFRKELAFCPFRNLVPETPRDLSVKAFIAPDKPAFQQSCSDRQILARHAHCVIDRAARLSDFKAQIPKEIEHGFDNLFAPRRTFHGGNESDIDVGMRRHLSAAVPAHSQNREPLSGCPVSDRIEALSHVIVNDPQQLIDEKCLRCSAFISC